MGYEQPLDESGSKNNNNEWGLDSHESNNVSMGSFQEVDGNQVCRDFDDNAAMQSPSTSTTTKSVHVQVQASSVQSREYLCAVSTAEEAESWVVALGWAAEHRRRMKFANQPTLKSTNTTSQQMNRKKKVSDMSEEEQIAEAITRSQKESASSSNNNNDSKRSSSTASELLSSLLVEQDDWCKTVSREDSLFPDEVEETEQLSKPQSPPKKKPASSPEGATIVVTKVSRLRLPHDALIGWNRHHHHHKNHQRTADTTGISWIPFHFPLPGDDLVLQYGVRLLLLRHCKTRNEKTVPESVEERTIYKSVRDILGLVHGLMAEIDNDAETHGIMSQESGESDKSTAPTQQKARARRATSSLNLSEDTSNLLEDIETELLSCLGLESSYKITEKSTSLTYVIDEISGMTSKTTDSIATIDSVMRKLSKDKEICSSQHFQKFLHLNSTHHKSNPIMMSKEADAEQIVKKWLSKTDVPSVRAKLELTCSVALRHWLAGPIISIMAIWLITRLASLIWSIVSGSSGIVISIPFDTYATLIAMSFYFGNNKGVSSRNRKTALQPSKSIRRKSKGEKLSESVTLSEVEDDESTVADEEEVVSESEDEDMFIAEPTTLSSPLPTYPDNYGTTCWSKPNHNIFKVRSATYLRNRVKLPSAPAVFDCRGVDVWLTDNAERNIARHPSVLGGKLDQEDSFIVNFLLPFGNLVAYFSIPPIEQMPANVAQVWRQFIKGDQQYRDGKLKLLPIVVDGPWIVKKAVGPGTAPAVIGRDLPLQYYFTDPTATKKGVYEVDVLVTASRIARGILNVVKGHTKSLTIAFAFINEASEESQLPENVLCAFVCHQIHLEDCPHLPDCYPDG